MPGAEQLAARARALGYQDRLAGLQQVRQVAEILVPVAQVRVGSPARRVVKHHRREDPGDIVIVDLIGPPSGEPGLQVTRFQRLVDRLALAVWQRADHVDPAVVQEMAILQVKAQLVGDLTCDHPIGNLLQLTHQVQVGLGIPAAHEALGRPDSDWDVFEPIEAMWRTVADLAAAGVRDCKTMTDRAVLTRAGHIERSTVNAVVTVKPERYISLYGEMGNLNRMLAWCHARAIENILEKVKCDYVLTDQFGDRSLVERALMDKGRRVTLEQRPRAEANIAVAAASVLARAKFVESLREMSDEYGTTLPKGASAKVDAAARDFVRAFGRAELHKVAKMHFRNAKKL